MGETRPGRGAVIARARLRADVREDGGASRLSPGDATHRTPTWPRWAAHVVVQLSVVLATAIQIGRGWRPISDDANIAFRSWLVFSRHTPLTGQYTQASLGSHHAIYDVGPLLYWVLAIPVHLDPRQGMLWGSAALMMAASALAVEAGWRTARTAGAACTALLVLGTQVVDPSVVVDPGWNPRMAIVWLVATGALAWCVGSGHPKALPLLVGAASLTCQCHLVAVPAALGVSLAAVAMLALGRPRMDRRRWTRVAAAASGVAGACWVAPVIQQFAAHPGNLTLLWRAADGGQRTGIRFGIQSVGSAVVPVPSWIHRPDPTQFLSVLGGLTRPSVAASVAGIALLAPVAVVGWKVRSRPIAAAAVVGLAAATGTAIAMGSMPQSALLTVTYLYPTVWPVGMAVLLVEGAGAVLLARSAASVASARLATFRPLRAPSSSRRSAWTAGAAMAVTGIVACGSVARDTVNAAPNLGGWPTMVNVTRVSRLLEADLPPGPVLLTTSGPGTIAEYQLIYGVNWALFVDGFAPRLEPGQAAYVTTADARSTSPPATTAFLTYRGSRLVVEVERSGRVEDVVSYAIGS